MSDQPERNGTAIEPTLINGLKCNAFLMLCDFFVDFVYYLYFSSCVSFLSHGAVLVFGFFSLHWIKKSFFFKFLIKLFPISCQLISILFCFSSYDNKSYGTSTPDSPSIVYCLHGRLSKTCCNEQVLELTQIESKCECNRAQKLNE